MKTSERFFVGSDAWRLSEEVRKLRWMDLMEYRQRPYTYGAHTHQDLQLEKGILCKLLACLCNLPCLYDLRASCKYGYR